MKNGALTPGFGMAFSAQKLRVSEDFSRRVVCRNSPLCGDVMKNLDNCTLEEAMQGRLYYLGMQEQEAIAVVERLKALPSLDHMKNRWGDRAQASPPELAGSLWIQTKKEAAKWIDENMPTHSTRRKFFEPSFVDSPGHDPKP